MGSFKAAAFGLGVLATLIFGVWAQSTADHDKIVSCYVGTWAFYRTGYGKFDIDDIDTTLCTHGFYGFADLDNKTWTVYEFDPWYDLAPDDCEPGFCNYDSYRRFNSLRSDTFKTMISIGGWNAGSGKYSLMAKDPVKRKTFIDSIPPFLEKYGFDGVDLDWENPGDRVGADPTVDKENFSRLVDELKAALTPGGYLLTAAVAPGIPKIDVAYDIPYISERFDFMNVMAYDYHGWFPDHEFTGHNSPLYRRKEEFVEGHPGYVFNVHDTVMRYIDGGAPLNKLVLGIPSYGRGFQLNDTEQTGLYCGAFDGIRLGSYTVQKGFWGYMEVLQAKKNTTLWNLPDATPHQWTTVRDNCYKAPYMYNGPYWIGYDDQESVSTKTRFANYLGVAGVMMWSLDTEDFYGLYSDAYPLMRDINKELALGMTFNPEDDPDCGTAPMCDTFGDLGTTTTTESTTTTSSGGLPGACKEDLELHAYPGDCHRYYRCFEQTDGSFTIKIYNCGSWAWNPNDNSCVDPELPANSRLCDDYFF